MANFAIGPADLPAGPLTKGLNAVFMQAYNEATKASISSRIATITTSDSDSEDYSWLGATATVREFLGERQARDLANFNYNIKNRVWENTLGIKRTDVENQKLGMITLRIQDLARQAAKYEDTLLLSFLLGAAGSDVAPYLCYDGTGLFDTAHPAPDYVGGATQGNIETLALNIANLWACIGNMRNLRDDKGNYLGIMPDVLIVETALEQIARELCPPAAAAAVSAQTAVMAQIGLEVIVAPELFHSATVANSLWFLADTKRPVRGLVVQRRSAIEFGSLEANSDSGFMRDEYLYGTRQVFNVGAGFWPAIYCSTGDA